MIKQAPSLGRIAAMVVFALSCVGILMFLWLAFGGPIPLKPQSYRFTASIPEAATLAQEADVRMAGVNVGKVKTKKLDKGAARTLVEIELDKKYAPIPKDTQAMLRQKTLLGETYVELAHGTKSAGMLDDGARLPNTHIESSVELDEIFNSFDKPTRAAFQEWVRELAKAIKGGRGQDLNDALGNLAPFSVDGAKLLRVLDEQGDAVHRLVKNTGVVFGALNQRQGALRDLIVNSNRTFEATASRDRALAETFRIFPTFLDESKTTMARLEGFSRNTHPLVNALKGPADDLGPTVRDLGNLAPDLQGLFRDLRPLVRTGNRSLPDAVKVLNGAEPVLGGIHTFLTELNPVLSFLNFHQATIAGFITIGGSNLAGHYGGQRYQVNFAPIEDRSFQRYLVEQPWERGQAYLQPNAYLRAVPLGVLESFNCPNGQVTDPVDTPPSGGVKQPPCFKSPKSLYDNEVFAHPHKGKAPKVDAPTGLEGTTTPRDPHPNDPTK